MAIPANYLPSNENTQVLSHFKVSVNQPIYWALPNKRGRNAWVHFSADWLSTGPTSKASNQSCRSKPLREEFMYEESLFVADVFMR